MTEQTPADQELLPLIEQHLGLRARRDDTVIDPRTGRFHDVQRYRDLAADILAKWGSPVVAREPRRVFIVATGEEHEGEATYTRYDDAPPPLCDSECLYTTPQPTQAQAGAVPPIEWPKARDVGRIGDMSPSAHLRVGLDSDNDVFVSVWDEQAGGAIEFCNPGGGGGGQSSRTRMALLALMVAMEADNAEKPSRDWWALRMGGITKEGGPAMSPAARSRRAQQQALEQLCRGDA